MKPLSVHRRHTLPGAAGAGERDIGANNAPRRKRGVRITPRSISGTSSRICVRIAAARAGE
ncbi:MAG: hypothetical protein MJE77_23630, partial [Proteobacteria bacterium]|nr:hypothetical protein [Pseudomonadota bacterium]